MGTCSNRHPMTSQANNVEASFPHFAWIHPDNLFSATKIGSNSFQATRMNKASGLAAVPIRSVAPMNESVETKPIKVNKKKSSGKSSNHIASKAVRPRQPKKRPSASKKTKGQIKPGVNIERKNPNIAVDQANFDISAVPPPFCSCTGVARGCYKWGAGGWQSSCCTTSISEYPLPMSPSRPGARVAGRKMSSGAYGKLLYRLAAEGCDLSHAVDLRNHWAKHGTNKFVTIK